MFPPDTIQMLGLFINLEQEKPGKAWEAYPEY